MRPARIQHRSINQHDLVHQSPRCQFVHGGLDSADRIVIALPGQPLLDDSVHRIRRPGMRPQIAQNFIARWDQTRLVLLAHRDNLISNEQALPLMDAATPIPLL